MNGLLLSERIPIGKPPAVKGCVNQAVLLDESGCFTE
jgi:hypothetical protein